MFTTITDRKAFGATYQWAILSVLPMDGDKTRHGLGPSEINRALGMPKEARTTVSILLKEMAAQGMVRRYEYSIGRRSFVSYKRLLPLRKRERIARFLGV
jgi:DNA-binding IclR family transcriptional regulator